MFKTFIYKKEFKMKKIEKYGIVAFVLINTSISIDKIENVNNFILNFNFI
jgi:hypothetical protein